MMEEIVNEENADNNGNVKETCIYHTKKGNITTRNITTPAMI